MIVLQFVLKDTVLYTIIDFKRNVRGRENLIFGKSFETSDDCWDALDRLEKGESEVSHRHVQSLNIEHKPIIQRLLLDNHVSISLVRLLSCKIYI